MFSKSTINYMWVNKHAVNSIFLVQWRVCAMQVKSLQGTCVRGKTPAPLYIAKNANIFLTWCDLLKIVLVRQNKKWTTRYFWWWHTKKAPSLWLVDKRLWNWHFCCHILLGHFQIWTSHWSAQTLRDGTFWWFACWWSREQFQQGDLRRLGSSWEKPKSFNALLPTRLWWTPGAKRCA